MMIITATARKFKQPGAVGMRTRLYVIEYVVSQVKQPVTVYRCTTLYVVQCRKSREKDIKTFEMGKSEYMLHL